MGGAAKHMMQLYHDHELSFDEMLDIFQLAASGEIEFTEKLDGMNIVFTWSPITGLRFARNDGDIASGGMDRSSLAERFSGRGNVERAFLESYDALHSVLHGPSLGGIFSGGRRWFSAEVLGPINPNIIHYSNKEIVLHNTNLHSNDEEFDSAFSRLLDSIVGNIPNSEWSVRGPSKIKLNLMTKEEFLIHQIALENLLERVDSSEYAEYHTVSSFAQERIHQRLMNEGMSYDASLLTSGRIVGNESCRDLRYLKKTFPYQAAQIEAAVKDEWNMFKWALEPLAKIVDDFGIALLRGVNSSHIRDNRAEVARLREVTSNEIDALKTVEEPKVRVFLEEHVAKLGSVSHIDTPIEGVVFKYNAKNYKFTGSFATANRILGYRRYGR